MTWVMWACYASRMSWWPSTGRNCNQLRPLIFAHSHNPSAPSHAPPTHADPELPSGSAAGVQPLPCGRCLCGMGRLLYASLRASGVDVDSLVSGADAATITSFLLDCR